MPRIALLACLGSLIPAMASAQWRGYAPDSAEYRLVTRSGTVGDSTRGMTSIVRAIVNARRRGDDSLTVHVSIVESSISFGDQVMPGPAAGMPVTDVVIPRRGMAPMTGTAAEPPIGGVGGFPHLFVLLAYPRRDAAGTLARDSGPDSLPLAGMRSSVRRSTLPDTVVAGIRVSRQAVEMVVENDSSVVVRPGLPPRPSHADAERDGALGGRGPSGHQGDHVESAPPRGREGGRGAGPRPGDRHSDGVRAREQLPALIGGGFTMPLM